MKKIIHKKRQLKIWIGIVTLLIVTTILPLIFKKISKIELVGNTNKMLIEQNAENIVSTEDNNE